MSQNIIAVNFNNQSLLATLVNDVPHVALKPICENLGLDFSAQVQKIKRHPVLNSTMVMITTVATDGKLREMLMLPLEYLNGWLFGIDSTRVKAEAKELVISYQRECFKVLANHFMPKRNGLVDLPASPFVTSKEKLLLRTAIEKHVAKTKEAHSYYWHRLHHAYHVSRLEDLPTGKVDEMLAFLGLREPTLDEYVIVKQERLLELEQNAKALPVQQIQTVTIPMSEYLSFRNDCRMTHSDWAYMLRQKGMQVITKEQVEKINSLVGMFEA